MEKFMIDIDIEMELNALLFNYINLSNEFKRFRIFLLNFHFIFFP